MCTYFCQFFLLIIWIFHTKILKNRRLINGSIEFETLEPKIICDESGYPLEIKPHERGVAESIIEEFMLIANQTVAKTIKNMNLPFLYRIHENPDPTKMAQMMKILKGLGINPHKKAEQITQFDLQKQLKFYFYFLHFRQSYSRI